MFLFRYWLFSDVVPGLYIEKGWVHESIDYSFTPPPEDKPAEPEVEEEEDGESTAPHESQGTVFSCATHVFLHISFCVVSSFVYVDA